MIYELGYGMSRHHAQIGGSEPSVEDTFDPSELSGLALWLDASDADTITASAGSVSQWDDKSGQAHHATQVIVSKRPVTGTRSLNGLNVLDYDGQKEMNGYSGLYSVPAGDNTVFIVVALDSTSGQRIFSGGVGSSSRWGLLYQLTTGAASFVSNSSFVTANVAVPSTTGLKIFAMNRNAATLTGYYNGSSATASSPAANVTIDRLVIGDQPSGDGSKLDGGLAEIVVFSRSLSNAEMNQMGAYFVSKWGAAWSDL